MPDFIGEKMLTPEVPEGFLQSRQPGGRFPSELCLQVVHIVGEGGLGIESGVLFLQMPLDVGMDGQDIEAGVRSGEIDKAVELCRHELL